MHTVPLYITPSVQWIYFMHLLVRYRTIFQFSMDLCAFSYVMIRIKLRTYRMSHPYHMVQTLDSTKEFIIFYFLYWYAFCVVPEPVPTYVRVQS